MENVRKQAWPDYRAVWRWHFYAGLLCIPFILWLSVTGAIYVFKPQVEAWFDAPYDHNEPAAFPKSAQAQVQLALGAVPGANFSAYQLSQNAEGAARVLLTKGDAKIRVYVRPSDALVMKAVNEDQRFMQQISFLHGELAIGDKGSLIVETAACWAIVMILTGLYLWWPRSVKGLGGVLLPRLDQGGRLFWRDIHAVTGAWVCALALFLLISGLPWAKNWGGYLKEVRAITHTTDGSQDWSTGRTSEIVQRRAAQQSAPDQMLDMDMPDGMTMPMKLQGPDLSALDRILPSVADLRLAPPILITPPKKGEPLWTVKSDAQNRTLRTAVQFDGATGEMIGRRNFNQRHPIDQIIGIGISAHEGQLFGWFNQALSVLAALGLILLSISAIVLWLRRKPSDALGAPDRIARPRFSFALLGIVALLAALFPLFGATLVIVQIAEFAMLRRVPSVRRWLGLTA